MKTRLTLSALLLSTLSLTAQADNAAERALQLNQAPLAPLNQQAEATERPTVSAHFGGGSAAMQKASAALKARSVETRFAVHDDALEPARHATS
ncbi:hypothetical protein [Halomonas organivorans]|uniref:DNA-binding ferritin-like protein n=1 Tax=Halomonas organivorans TaxID=257772 RepID=A0A7W5BX87_9GAMM|nr:hypothetical protein [Halomonas organivorans]MBB3139813.1 DNA-binding ferritin-like protein [Halomonas organivorans]